MTTITVSIPKAKTKAFLKKLEEWGYAKHVEVEEDEGPTKEEILAGLKEAVEEVKLIRAGKMKAVPAKDLFKALI
jgi:hypothetical protein